MSFEANIKYLDKLYLTCLYMCESGFFDIISSNDTITRSKHGEDHKCLQQVDSLSQRYYPVENDQYVFTL